MNVRRVGVLVVIATAGCTARLYPGPKRPDAEVATLETDGMTIVAVDEQRAQPGIGPSRYEILAGMHSVSVRLNDDHPVFAGSAAGGRRSSEDALAVCFRARGEHTYLLRPVYSGPTWRPEVIDEKVTGVIVTKGTSAVAPDCSPEAPRVPPNVAPAASEDEAAPGPTAAGAVPAAAGPDASTVANAADAGTAATDDDSPAPLPPPPRAVRPATDREVPRIRPRRPTYGRDAAPPPPPAHPGTGIGLELGLAFGGDELVTAELSNGQTDTLHAGDGLLVAVVGDLTPFWVGDSFGLGLGVSVGWKYGDVGASNGRFRCRAFQFRPSFRSCRGSTAAGSFCCAGA
jgi:hypothetical protein